MTGMVLRSKFAKRRQRFGLNNNSNNPTAVISTENRAGLNFTNNPNMERLKPEVAIFINLISMIAAFTVTLVPFAVVIFILGGTIQDSQKRAWSFVITFFGSLANCFANAVIYSFRDQRFREAVKGVFFSVFRR